MGGKTGRKNQCAYLSPPGGNLGGKDRAPAGSVYFTDTGLAGEEGYFYCLRDKWQDHDQQYAVRSAGSGRIPGGL